MPALLNTKLTWSVSCCSSTSSRKLTTCASSPTSQEWVVMRVPAGASFSARSAVSVRLSSSRSHVATEQPSAANWMTSSRPIPVPPPVTTARRPAKSTVSPLVDRQATRCARLHAVEEVGLLGGELLLADHAALTELVELLDLLGNRRRRRLRDRGTAAEVSLRVRLHLAIDLVLHERRLAHVGERLGAAFARRLDTEITGPEHPLEDRLVEEDGVDALERDLDAFLRHDARAGDDPFGGDDE